MSAPAEPLRFLEWDTDFFGVRIAALSRAPAGDEDVRAAMEAARAARIACVYALCDVENRAGVRALGSAGARLVDVRVTFDADLRTLVMPAAATRARAALPGDVPALRALAATSHGASRFYADGRFPRERCDELFATWIEKSCAGWADVVRVAGDGARIDGYTTGHARVEGRGEIGLVAVDERARGRGLGAELVSDVLSDFRRRGLSRATVVTQGMNVAAQRLYQSLGFRTLRLQTWHHLWLDELR
jgi:dTDP-4-amino-4,6-dideoxy-D-galactose acyltransferase